MHLSLERWRLRGAVALAALLVTAMFAPAFVNAQSQAEAQLAVRMQELEDRVRDLTGQLEGLQFSITNMQTQLQQMADDNEFRFQQLEGGGAGKTEAAPQSGGVTPPAEAPQPDTGTQTPDTTQLPAPAAPDDAIPVISDEPMHGDVGDSADPLLGQGQAGAAPAVGTLGESSVPLNLNLDGGTVIEDGDARAQYAAGYDAIVRGDYGFAEEQFRQFVALYPNDPQAPDAVNWLGEALLQRGAYDEAADVLFSGFQAYENSARAPDLLLKLSTALAGAGETEVACRTYAEVAKRYADQPAAFLQKLAAERQKANCPG